VPKGVESHGDRRIKALKDHPEPYVTTSELAEYWNVSRKQIYKQIEAGTLRAIRLGPRLLRISTAEALRFERIAKMAAFDGAQIDE
jgi:excisionase family DNA binding protein